MPSSRQFDFLVIGSGIAGLFYSLRVAAHGTVGLVTKKRGSDSATNWAQGGIAAVIAPEDSFDDHVRDTVNAGAGLCKEDVVRYVVERGPRMIDALRKNGVEFDQAAHGSSERAADSPVARRRSKRHLRQRTPPCGRHRARQE